MAYSDTIHQGYERELPHLVGRTLRTTITLPGSAYDPSRKAGWTAPITRAWRVGSNWGGYVMVEAGGMTFCPGDGCEIVEDDLP